MHAKFCCKNFEYYTIILRATIFSWTRCTNVNPIHAIWSRRIWNQMKNQTNEFILKNLTTPKCWVQCILDNSNNMSNTCDSQFQWCVWWILEARYLAGFWLCHTLNKCNDLHLCFYQPYHRFNKQPLFGCHFARWLAQTGNLLQYFDAFIDLLAKLTRTIFSNLCKTHVTSITAKLHTYQ